MRVFIIEDNSSHLNVLIAKVESLDYNVVGTSQTVTNALSKVKNTSPDIVLVDINLNGDNDGIDLAKKIKKESTASVIFITSQSEDLILQDAIAIEPSGYLTKPVDPIDLKASIELAIYKKEQKIKEHEIIELKKDFITVRTGKKLQLLLFKNIKLLQVEVKNYVTLIDKENKQFVIRDSLKNVLISALPNGFMRTHNSYGVNIDYVAFIDEKEQMLHLKTNDAVPIGKAFKEIVYQKMNIKT